VRVASLIDVDNTLIDNDAAKVEIDRRLDALLGDAGSDRFWALYEEVRAELGLVDIPRTMARTLGPDRPLADRVALAEIFMRFPFRDFLYPGALELIDRLRARGPVVILSDGDPVFQPAKIHQAGLTEAVEGHVLIFPHKEEHLLEIGAAFPADCYLLIDDKPGVIERMRARAAELPAPLKTVLVRQGKYAAAVPPGTWPGADYTAPAIADVWDVIAL
jgi:hypothetical protein